MTGDLDVGAESQDKMLPEMLVQKPVRKVWSGQGSSDTKERNHGWHTVTMYQHIHAEQWRMLSPML